MNTASDSVTQDMPKQLWYTDGICEYTFETKTWQVNAANAPKLEGFARPEDRPGWQVEVGEWRFKWAKH